MFISSFVCPRFELHRFWVVCSSLVLPLNPVIISVILRSTCFNTGVTRAETTYAFWQEYVCVAGFPSMNRSVKTRCHLVDRQLPVPWAPWIACGMPDGLGGDWRDPGSVLLLPLTVSSPDTPTSIILDIFLFLWRFAFIRTSPVIPSL